MPPKSDTSTWLGTHARVARIALFALAAATLAFLFAAQPGHALDLPTAPIAGLNEAEEEPFEELEEGDECEEFEVESEEDETAFEEECEEPEEDERRGAAPPPECMLRTVSARVFTPAARNQVILVVGYTSFSPASASVDYRLQGGKGALSLGRTTRQFAKQGVFRLTRKLSDSQMEKVKAARDFEVRIRIPSAPGYCRGYYTRHLKTKRKVNGQVVWYQSGPSTPAS